MRRLAAVLLFALLLLPATAQDVPQTERVILNYISPDELTEILGLGHHEQAGLRTLRVDPRRSDTDVFVRFNPGLNQVLLTGDDALIAQARTLIEMVDVAPRQIIVEVQILEINEDKSRDAGLDWQTLLDEADINAYISFQNNGDERVRSSNRNAEGELVGTVSETVTERDYPYDYSRVNVDARGFSLGDFIRVVRETGTGTLRSAPRIVTLNNEEGMILDGARINYVSKIATYANVFETQELTTGLTLSVTPSLGESGYLKLDVTAKLTTLGQIIDNSPSEVGQILENTVVVREGETFLLGGLKQVEQAKIRRKVPLLGTILPFLFSRMIDVEIRKDVLILLTPRVIDLESAPFELPAEEEG